MEKVKNNSHVLETIKTVSQIELTDHGDWNPLNYSN